MVFLGVVLREEVFPLLAGAFFEVDFFGVVFGLDLDILSKVIFFVTTAFFLETFYFLRAFVAFAKPTRLFTALRSL